MSPNAPVPTKVSVTNPGATANPTDLTAKQTGSGEVFLSWRPVEGPPEFPLVGYVVVGPGAPGDMVTVPALTATGVPLGSQQWAVGSVFNTGTGGPQATPVAAFPRVTLNVVVGAWRVNPAGFTAVQTAPGQVQFSWQPVTGPGYYELQGPGLPAGIAGVSGATTFTATGIPIGSHQWELRSVYDSAPFRTAPSEFPKTALNVVLWPVNPSGFTAVQTAPSQVRLSWQPVTAASFYLLLGPGLPAGGAKVTGAATFTATAVPAGNQEWAVASFYEPGNASTPAAEFPRVTLNVTGPPPTVPPPVLSGRYLVTVTGLRAYQVSMDDQLSRDGRGDEVYAGAYIRRYDRRTGEIVEFPVRKTMTYGDVNNFGSQRVQAGTMSGTGGIRDGDPIPPGPLFVTRSVPAQDTTFPWRLWEGTLTNDADALVITPSLWEKDFNDAIYPLWEQQQQGLNVSLFTTPGVQDQITQKAFGVLTSGAAGMPVANLAVAWANVLLATNDRPIGMMANGFGQAMLLNQVIVLTREIIEAALALPALGAIPSPIANLQASAQWQSVPAIARIGVTALKPGIIVVQFEDKNLPGFTGIISERPAIYQMFIQVERVVP